MVGVAGSLDERRRRRRTGLGQQPRVQHIHKPGQVVRRAQRLQNQVAGELQSAVRDEQLVGAQHQEQPQLEPLQAAVLQITKALKEKPRRAHRLLKSGGENHRLRRHRPRWTQLGLNFFFSQYVSFSLGCVLISCKTRVCRSREIKSAQEAGIC
jgi:hypothetical protein